MTLSDSPLFVIQNAIIPNINTDKPHDLLVKGDKISDYAPAGKLNFPVEAEKIDANGCRLYPSFIDAHVHLREPGFEYKEDIASGLSAAAHGGFGAVMAMANTRPVNDKPSVTEYVLRAAKKHYPFGPRLLPIGALTIGLEGKELSPMAELKHAGCVAFSDDGRPVADTEIFRHGVKCASQLGRMVIDHCEDPDLSKNSCMNEGKVADQLGVRGQPTIAEAIQVGRDILLAEYLNMPIHLAHISCHESLELIRAAKARGVMVTAETCPHYLYLDESALVKYNANAKVNPPLRHADDVAAIIKAVSDGTIDIFATDHAPHAAYEKDKAIAIAASGFIGLETAVSLTYDFVRRNIIKESDFIRMWHDRPAEIFDIPINKFAIGDSADFFIFDPNFEWQVSPENLHSKSFNTPFLGQTLKGKVTAHWLGGHRIV